MKTWRGAGEQGARAERLRLRPWTDPRLLLGLLLVVAATIVGARALAAADNTEQFWAVASDVQAGDVVTEADLVATNARLTGDAGDRYLRVDDELPGQLADLQWAGDSPRGSLVRPHDLVDRADATHRQVPVTVSETAMPSDLDRGDQVQVWVSAGPGDQSTEPAELVLDGVTVMNTGSREGALDSSSRSVLLQVPPAQLEGEVISAVASGYVTLVRIP